MFKNINPLKWRTSTKALWMSFLLPMVIMLTYFASRHMAPFGSSSILTVDLGQQYIDFYAGFRQTILHDPLRIFYDFSKGLGGETYGDCLLFIKPNQFFIIALFKRPRASRYPTADRFKIWSGRLEFRLCYS